MLKIIILYASAVADVFIAVAVDVYAVDVYAVVVYATVVVIVTKFHLPSNIFYKFQVFFPFTVLNNISSQYPSSHSRFMFTIKPH